MKYFSNAGIWAEGTADAWFKCGKIDTSSILHRTFTRFYDPKTVVR